MSGKLIAAAVALMVASGGAMGTAANAAVVPFLENPSTQWTDGSFTGGFARSYADGFYNYGTGPTRAFNGYGQNNESILFNTGVALTSLTLGNCDFCGLNAATVTVALYDEAGGLLASQTIVPLDALTRLTFTADGVRKATFSFTGGRNFYGDGRIVAFYNLNDVTYTGGSYTGSSSTEQTGTGTTIITVTGSTAAVPDTATWALLLAGFGLTGAALRQRRATRVA